MFGYRAFYYVSFLVTALMHLYFSDLISTFAMIVFDEIETPGGFGNIARPYKGLVFNDFYAFKPSHPRLDGVISSYDLNCAVSKPNALYGAANPDTLDDQGGYRATPGERPSICPYTSSESFSVHALKIKPLDMPVGSVTINLQGFRGRKAEDTLSWSVAFPAGFHDVLHIRVEKFTGRTWEGLTRLEVWADFQFENIRMEDWEFCIDDLEFELGSRART
ncbi:uncharacterized protein Z520_07912 [Fonsecaea multimorphosa CBS 102226]|uniref:Uncharacterized protein n=1 Tax=Fonsecaea multimorphosa CBS 102226 TaxID=1442371 RepID=A0A0D2JZS7_9EURO|nr:uncharacterized protein Z520_07912 [Fonsecaea multimorphosa CBS 102226]KIX96134.1 hypothetical protein Z520_07912 [Fonsecaea multimorphosa CBS 102226]